MPGMFSDFKGDIWNFGDVLKWIKENVPCTTGQIAAEWTQRVYDEARLHNIDRLSFKRLWPRRSRRATGST